MTIIPRAWRPGFSQWVKKETIAAAGPPSSQQWYTARHTGRTKDTQPNQRNTCDITSAPFYLREFPRPTQKFRTFQLSHPKHESRYGSIQKQKCANVIMAPRGHNRFYSTLTTIPFLLKKSAAGHAVFGIYRPPPQDLFVIMETLRHVTLKRSNFGYGFLLKDDGRPFGSTALVVKVERGGSADAGGIRVGSRVQALNGQPVRSMTFLQISNIIRSSRNTLNVSFIDPSPVVTEKSVSSGPEDEIAHPATSMSRTSHRHDPEEHPSNGTLFGSVVQMTETEVPAMNPYDSTISFSPHNPTDEYKCLSSSLQNSPIVPTIPDYANPESSARNSEHTDSVTEQQMVLQPRVDSLHSSPSPSDSSSHLITSNLGLSHNASPLPLRKNSSNANSGVSPLFTKLQSSPVLEERILYPSSCVEPRKPATSVDPGSADVSTSKESPCQQDTSDEHSIRRTRQTNPTRRLTIDRPECNEELTETIHFVRKRAYASARYSSKTDQFLGLSPKLSVSNDVSADSPCQLLPAAPQHTSPGSAYVIEPRITHLPGRRSSGRTHTAMAKPFPSPSTHTSPSGLKLAECPLSSSQSTDGLSSSSADANSRLSPERNPLSADSIDRSVTISMERRDSGNGGQDLMRNPNGPLLSTNGQSKQSTASRPNGTHSNDGLDVPFASATERFTVNSHGGNFATSDNPWVKAGEAYQEIEAANQELARRLINQSVEADLVDSQRGLLMCDTLHGIERGQQNKENRLALPRYEAWLASGIWYTSKPQRAPFVQRVPLVHSPAVDSAKGVSVHGTTPSRLWYRSQRLDTIRDLSGSFFSRQCLCRILTVDGSLTKSYQWKAYYMCIGGNEVRFVKSSWAYLSSGRNARPSRAAPVKTAIKHTDHSVQSDDRASLDSTWDQTSLSDRDAGMSDNSQFSYSVTEEQEQRRPNPPKLSASCILLPIKGLFWVQEDLPPDFPEWSPMGSVSHAARRKPANPVPAVTRDYMDPSKSGISRSDSSNNNNHSAVAPFRCLAAMSHEGGTRAEILPDCPSLDRGSRVRTTDLQVSLGNPALVLLSGGMTARHRKGATAERCVTFACSRLCLPTSGQSNPLMSGGKMIQPNAPDSGTSKDEGKFSLHLMVITDFIPVFYRPTQNPYALRLLSTQASPTTADSNERRYLTFGSVSGNITLSDKRQRRTGPRRGTVRARSTERPSSHRREGSEHGPRSKPVGTVDDIDIGLTKAESSSPGLSGMDEKVACTSFTRTTRNPFLQSLRQLLNWSNAPTDTNTGTLEESADRPVFIPISPKKLKDRLDAILGDPPDFSDVDTPGPTFGCALEQQLESPDYPCVPAMLHAFLASLDAHGLHLPGMYRKPGRQRSMNQFICVANLLPHDVDFLLTLDAWREPYAIGGLVKQFLRRLPRRLLDLPTWEPLAALVPDRTSTVDVSRLAYLLLSVRVKLSKMAHEAFTIPKGRFFPDSSAFSADSVSVQQSSSVQPSANSNNTESVDSSPPLLRSSRRSGREYSAARWRWATLCHVIQHLRRLVSFEQRNEVTYQCVAICFGPVLFADSLQVDKLNYILECILRHWSWLIDGLPTNDANSSSLPKRSPRLEDSVLAETVRYLQHFDDQKSTMDRLSVSERLSDSLTVTRFGRENTEASDYRNSSALGTDYRRSTRINSANAIEDVQDCVRSILSRALKSNRQHSAPDSATEVCSTLPVPSCHATRRKHEGWDTARLPKPRQGKSRGGGRIRTTDLPVSKLALSSQRNITSSVVATFQRIATSPIMAYRGKIHPHRTSGYSLYETRNPNPVLPLFGPLVVGLPWSHVLRVVKFPSRTKKPIKHSAPALFPVGLFKHDTKAPHLPTHEPSVRRTLVTEIIRRPAMPRHPLTTAHDLGSPKSSS
ncbi:LOW QUALITY PROTEIN: hypothetical protein T265_14657 [Opisthorchis viverrini]|uniref:RhoGAP domain protein n=1 Tax=Opisthorchis viverrini TaxID=6198 RepID=A0A074Z8A6_OPIVI|nr:LOW QUALITY PROTEIN: hypothetical protein T265_14657 [Opisthorchis viverrini]KER23343.1 LOW QUALITY PROTEIN: hypothetical protein T265_14657 [Opisthorchis viverrini]